VSTELHIERTGKEIVSPDPGRPFTVAFHDLAEAANLAPVWLNAGWIDVVWRFRRTRLGPFWHTLNLAAFVLVIGVVWSAMLHQDPLSYFRYVTVSLIVWGLIASFITDGTNILIAGQSTALSMRFPFVAFAFAHAWRALLLFAHHFAFYVAVMVGTLTSPGLSVLLAIPGLALVVANGVWMSLLSGIVCLRWRDMAQATSSAMQIAMFITPVFWPRTLLGPELAFVVDFNPLYHLVQIMREPLLGNLPPFESWLWASITFIVGSTITMWVYGRNRDRLPYWY
jgi:ABC-2 type transport system permease protein